MVITEEEYKDKSLETIAMLMCNAARTAPKAKGTDLIVTAIAKGTDITKLSDAMLKIQKEEGGSQSFVRDAEGIKKVNYIVLIGTKLAPINLKACGYCGYKDCAAMEEAGAICAYNPGDLGIAVGSALSIAADLRADNRLMFSVGKAAIKLKMLGDEVKIAFGIPLSSTGKNPFFDRS